MQPGGLTGRLGPLTFTLRRVSEFDVRDTTASFPERIGQTSHRRPLLGGCCCAACVSDSLDHSWAHVAPYVSPLVPLCGAAAQVAPIPRASRRGPYLPSLNDLGGGDHLLGSHIHRESPPFMCSSSQVLRETAALMQLTRPVVVKDVECLGCPY
jgi:hypothetical protein